LREDLGFARGALSHSRCPPSNDFVTFTSLNVQEQPVFHRAEKDAAVIWFIAQKVGVRQEQVNPETRIAEDLGVDGDDAEELMDEFAESFNVDLSAFRFEEHFGGEGIPLTISTAGCALLLLTASSVAAISISIWPWTAAIWLLVVVAIITRLVRWSKTTKPGTLRVSHFLEAAAVGRWVFPYERG
jgi:acyl carrier protein